ncbi:Uncharacterized protein APZ42_016936 [Daphnia magna]|uniref:Uncharacterized protein n=1 Tax=Daphnia magna TaxID=35525 RepID=A0A165A8C0_9CRUS|nr:Uncharacterized protein APZ42_016936 [Daphnia magna]
MCMFGKNLFHKVSHLRLWAPILRIAPKRKRNPTTINGEDTT